jgi:hypothetical protein
MPLYDLTVEPVLDRIASHLATQYGQSLAYCANSTTNCAMRGDLGTRCAVGVLISDDQMQRFNVEQTAAVPGLAAELLDELRTQYAPESGGPEFVHALMMAQRYHDGGWTEVSPRYTDRLEQYERGDPDLRVKILEDLRSRYVSTRIGD